LTTCETDDDDDDDDNDGNNSSSNNYRISIHSLLHQMAAQKVFSAVLS